MLRAVVAWESSANFFHSAFLFLSKLTLLSLMVHRQWMVHKVSKESFRASCLGLVELQASFHASVTFSSAWLPRQAHQVIPTLSVVSAESLWMRPYCSHLRQRYCLPPLFFVRYGYLSKSPLVIRLAAISRRLYPFSVERPQIE